MAIVTPNLPRDLYELQLYFVRLLTFEQNLVLEMTRDNDFIDHLGYMVTLPIEDMPGQPYSHGRYYHEFEQHLN